VTSTNADRARLGPCKHAAPGNIVATSARGNGAAAGPWQHPDARGSTSAVTIEEREARMVTPTWQHRERRILDYVVWV
jgi:hypothetical protein